MSVSEHTSMIMIPMAEPVLQSATLAVPFSPSLTPSTTPNISTSSYPGMNKAPATWLRDTQELLASRASS